MQETFSSGSRTIRLDVHAPAGRSPVPAIILMHGAGGNVGFWLDRLAPQLAAAGVALFAPHYFDRTGTDRADFATITDGVHASQWIDTLRTAHEVVAARPEVDPKRIALIGISLGAFLSLAYAAQVSGSAAETRNALRCVVDISGGLVSPFDAQATPAFPPTLVLHGANDSVVPVSHAHHLDTLLTRLGVAHETHILAGEGHWFSPAAQLQLLLKMAPFLSRHLG